MPQIVWDRVGERLYETGLDRGVLYLPGGVAVPWNGLTSVIEAFDKETQPVYFDGMKIQDATVLGDFQATLKAVTYPDDFMEIEGYRSNRRGLFYGNQPPKTFGLAYRTLIGDDASGAEAGYKIHLLYNITAIPSDKTYASLGDDPSLVEFEWTLAAVPQEVPGFRPTAHIILDSRDFDPWLMEELEAMFYGTELSDAALIPMPQLVTYINEWFRVKIIDNGDGTWTAETARDGFINFGLNDYFEIIGVNAIYLNDYTFQLTDTLDVADVPELKIIDNGNGTWTAITSADELIDINPDGSFSILNANAEYLSDDIYRLSNTEE